MEDFVPFEIANKLKEKGFSLGKTEIYGKFDSDGLFHPQLYFNYIETMDCDEIVAPTISQVLKWLRDKHATHIEISLGRNGWYFEIIQYEYYEEEKEYGCKLITISVIYDSYENSALAGIEYSLDNLI